MKNIHLILHVARNEFRIGRRNWIYRFFFVLTLAVTSYYLLFFQSSIHNFGYLMYAIPSSIPFMNAYIFNFLQIILFGFLALELFARERTIGTLEVMRVRPYGNAVYLTGKMLGFFFLYLLLAGVTTLVALLLHVFFCEYSPLTPWLYVFYPLTFTLPVFVLITATAFLFGSSSRGRLLPLLLLLTGIYLCFLFGRKVLPFDPFARMLPNGYSDVTGFGGLNIYMSHRLSFLLAGFGLLCFVPLLLKRLPNRKRFAKTSWLIPGTLLLLGSVLLGYHPVKELKQEQEIRNTYRTVYEKYIPQSRGICMEQHDITCKRENGKLALTSRLQVKNTAKTTIQQIVLYLNPALQISTIRKSNQPIPFQREQQAVVLTILLTAGETVELEIDYTGNIDERICYLDIPDADYYQPGYVKQAYIADRRYAFSTGDFTLLLPECLWYPVVTPPVNTLSPYETILNPGRFRLQVTGFPKGQKIIAQGTRSTRGDTLVFDAPHLTSLTLCAGPFEERLVAVDSQFTVGVYTFPKHALFGNPAEFLAQGFKHCLNTYNLPKPGKQLYFVETPFSFTTYFRTWKLGSEWVQPEMIFLPEAEHAKWAPQAYQKDELNLEYMMFYLKPFFRGNIQSGYTDIVYFGTLCSDNDEYQQSNKYWIGQLFAPYSITDEAYPVLNTLLRNIRINTLAGAGYHFLNPIVESNIPDALKYLAKGHSFQEALQDKRLPRETLDALLLLKGDELSRYLQLHGTEELFQAFQKRIAALPMCTQETLEQEISRHFNIDIREYLHQWHTSSSLPLYEISNIKILKDKTSSKPFIRFNIKNTGKRDGIIHVEAKINNSFTTNHYNYFIEKGSCKTIMLPGEIYSLTVNTGVSQNIPHLQQLSPSNRKREVTPDLVAGISDITLENDEKTTTEIIVDNTDPGFRLISPPRKKLQEWFRPEKREETFQHLGRLQLQLANEWAYVIDNQLYGKTVRDAWYKCSGTGKWEAEWKTDLKETGTYEVFVYNVKLSAYVSNTNRLSTAHQDYTVHYTIHSTQGAEHIVFCPAQNPAGWVSLGKFKFEPGEAKIRLNDNGTKLNLGESRLRENFRSFFNWKSNMRIVVASNQIIVADAVKWVKVNP